MQLVMKSSLETIIEQGGLFEMKKIAFILCMVVVLSSFLVVSTAYAKTSENGRGLLEWVTGGGQIYLGPPGSQAYTVAGTIGKTSDGDIRGNLVVIDRSNNVSLRFIELDYMDVDGNAATIEGTVQAYVNDTKENIQTWVIMTITDNGEPGAGVDTIVGDSANGEFGGVIVAGNFQVHSK